jgi:hypothetical protein
VPSFHRDIADAGYAALTIRVAWALLVRGVKVRADVLADARDHALFHLPSDADLNRAEDEATYWTFRFVDRARRSVEDDPWSNDVAMPLSPRWVRALQRERDPLARRVLRAHYADGRDLGAVATQLGIDDAEVAASREGLRELLRHLATADGVPLHKWPVERLDRVLERVAAWAPDTGCPPLAEVVLGGHKEHRVWCPRCDRARRLVQRRVLTADDLRAPPAPARPKDALRVLALHVHPDSRRYLGRVAHALAGRVARLDEDVLLVELADPAAVAAALSECARRGAPPREHLRGAVIEGPGRWSERGPLGPLPSKAFAQVRVRPWGRVDGLGDLPSRAPAPPSARPYWTAAAAAAVYAAAALGFALTPPAAPPAHGLVAEFTPGRGGVWTAFEVDDDASVLLVREAEGRLDVVVQADDPLAKLAVATGDGSFRVHTSGEGVLVAATDGRLEAGPLLAEAAASPDPLAALAAAVKKAAPDADLRTYRR